MIRIGWGTDSFLPLGNCKKNRCGFLDFFLLSCFIFAPKPSQTNIFVRRHILCSYGLLCLLPIALSLDIGMAETQLRKHMKCQTSFSHAVLFIFFPRVSFREWKWATNGKKHETNRPKNNLQPMVSNQWNPPKNRYPRQKDEMRRADRERVLDPQQNPGALRRYCDDWTITTRHFGRNITPSCFESTPG